MSSRLTRNFATNEELSKLGILDAELYDSVTAALPALTPFLVDGQAVIDQDRVLFSNLAAGNLRIYQATIIGPAITWTDISLSTLDEDQKILVHFGTLNQKNIMQVRGGAVVVANEGLNPAAGEANTSSNAGAGGAGTAALAKAKVGVDLPFRRLKQGANITVTELANEVQIDATGEANTSSNAGAGGAGIVDLAKAKVGVDLPFRRLKQGANITLTQNADDIQIDAAAGSGITIVLNGGVIPAAVDGDVLLLGTSTITANTVIKGNIFFNNTAGQNIVGDFTLTVHGSIYGNAASIPTIDLSSAVGSGKTLLVKGSIHNCNVTSNGANLLGAIGGLGGPITIEGDVVGLATFNSNGGTSDNLKGGNGGTVTIYGNAKLTAINCNGGISTTANGGDGGTIDLRGNYTGALSAIGANAAVGGTTGGTGGSITIGTTTSGNSNVGNVSSYGGNSTTGVGASGGAITFRGILKSNGTIQSNGGNSLDNNGGAAGAITFSSYSAVQTVNANGGNAGTAGTPGQAGAVTFSQDCYIGNSVSSNGGNATSTGLNGRTGGTITFNGNVHGSMTISNINANGGSGRSSNGGTIIFNGNCEIQSIRVNGGDMIVGDVGGTSGNGGSLTASSGGHIYADLIESRPGTPTAAATNEGRGGLIRMGRGCKIRSLDMSDRGIVASIGGIATLEIAGICHIDDIITTAAARFNTYIQGFVTTGVGFNQDTILMMKTLTGMTTLRNVGPGTNTAVLANVSQKIYRHATLSVASVWRSTVDDGVAS